MKSGIKKIALWLILLCVFLLVLSAISNSVNKQLSYSKLLQEIENNNVEKVTISDDGKSALVTIKEGDNAGEKNVMIPSLDNFIDRTTDRLTKGEIELTQTEKSQFVAVLETFGPTILLMIFIFFAWMLFMNPGSQGGNKTMSFGKSKARMMTPADKNKITFADVAGVDEEKEELEEIVEFLKSPKKYTDMGARIPKGVLLVGHPGTGKTLLAKAVAGEAGVPFFIISGSDFVEMFVGVGASRVRDLFEQAKKNAPCIIFIDEIDAVGRQRGAGLGGGHDEREQTLNQLLVEMDGFSANEGVIVLAATNRPDVLDKALLRAGRFDRQIVVGTPDVKAREQILEVHARKKKLADDVDLGTIAKNTSGLGPEKKTKVISDKEKKLVAFHEAGHAVVSKFLPTQDQVHQISIIPRGMAGGYTMYKPSEDKSFMSKTEMEERIVSLLGGRVAEQLVLGDISTGASNDIERASDIARSMVMKYGMSEKLGTIAFGSGQEEIFLGRDIAQGRNYSEQTSADIDSEVRRIIDKAYKTAEQILTMQMDKLTAVANVLLEKEKIDGEEFEEIFNS